MLKVEEHGHDVDKAKVTSAAQLLHNQVNIHIYVSCMSVCVYRRLCSPPGRNLRNRKQLSERETRYATCNKVFAIISN